jgi:hypothetical protein
MTCCHENADHLFAGNWFEVMCSECADIARAMSNLAKCIKAAALEEMRVRAAVERVWNQRLA